MLAKIIDWSARNRFLVLLTTLFVVVGGLGSITGSAIGAVVITILLEWLRLVEDTITIGSFQIPGVPGMRMVIFSVILLFIILKRREGIIGGYEFSWDSVTRLFNRKGDK